MASSRGKSDSEFSREDNSRLTEPLSNGTTQTTTISVAQNLFSNPNELSDGAGQKYYGQNISLSPMLITANHTAYLRATSPLTYTPYNKQLIGQIGNPTLSNNEARVQVSYSSHSGNYMGHGYTSPKPPNIHIPRGSFDNK